MALQSFALYQQYVPFLPGETNHICNEVDDQETCTQTYKELHQRVERAIYLTYLKTRYSDMLLEEKKQYFKKLYDTILVLQTKFQNQKFQSSNTNVYNKKIYIVDLLAKEMKYLQRNAFQDDKETEEQRLCKLSHTCSDADICGNSYKTVKIPYAYEDQNHLYYTRDSSFSFRNVTKQSNKDVLQIPIAWTVYTNECYAVRDGVYNFSHDAYPLDRVKVHINAHMFQVFKYKDAVDALKQRSGADAYK